MVPGLGEAVGRIAVGRKLGIIKRSMTAVAQACLHGRAPCQSMDR